MIVRVGQTIQDKQLSGTYNGIYVQAYLLATAVNTAIVNSDFNPSGVNIKVVLKRASGTIVVMQDNLLLLGTYCSLKNNLHHFFNGFDKIYPAAAAKHVKLKSVFLDFGGFIKVNSGEELLIEVSAAQLGTFSSNLDQANSFVEFWANPAIGYEQYVPIVVSQVVQATTSKQQFNPGNGIIRMIALNFDKDSLANEVISNLSLQSDRLDLSLSFNQLLAHSQSYYKDSPERRFGTSVPTSLASPTVVRGLDLYPQSMVLFDGYHSDKQIDQTRVDVSFNSPNVAASQNYFVWTQKIESLETMLKAAQTEAKHDQEKIDKLSSSR